MGKQSYENVVLSLNSDVLSANDNVLFDSIAFTINDDDLLRYFGDETTGVYDAEFDVSFALYSSIAYDDNPVRLCNDNADEMGVITLEKAVELKGQIGGDGQCKSADDNMIEADAGKKKKGSKSGRASKP